MPLHPLTNFEIVLGLNMFLKKLKMPYFYCGPLSQSRKSDKQGQLAIKRAINLCEVNMQILDNNIVTQVGSGQQHKEMHNK